MSDETAEDTYWREITEAADARNGHTPGRITMPPGEALPVQVTATMWIEAKGHSPDAALCGLRRQVEHRRYGRLGVGGRGSVNRPLARRRRLPGVRPTHPEREVVSVSDDELNRLVAYLTEKQLAWPHLGRDDAIRTAVATTVADVALVYEGILDVDDYAPDGLVRHQRPKRVHRRP